MVTQGTAHIVREGDKYVARATRKLTMGAFDQMMQLEIVNDPSAGDQKPLKVECLEALSGKLTLQSLGANSCKGEALVAIHTNGAGEMPYELECGPGKSWQRKVAATANKIGVDKVQFNVTNNEQVACALRTRIGGKLKPLDGASMTFQCHKSIDVGASDDLVPETRPDPQQPGKPGKVVIDPPRQTDEPKIGCAGGTVKNGACDASARTRRLRPARTPGVASGLRSIRSLTSLPSRNRRSVARVARSEAAPACAAAPKAGQGRQERLALRQDRGDRPAARQGQRQQV